MKTLDTYNITVFDTETTGLSPMNDYVTQWSCSNLPKLGHKKEDTSDFFNQYINPPKDVNMTNSAKINGITRAVLRDRDAKQFNVVFTMFKEWVESHFGNEDVYLIAHNCHSFDMRFLEVECKRHGLIIPTNWIFIDSLRQFRKYNPDIECENYKLGTLFEWLKDEETNIEGDLHDSLTDVKVLMFIYLKLSSQFTQKQIDTILKEGKRSIQYSESYLELPISNLMSFAKNHILIMEKYNIVSIGDMVSFYNRSVSESSDDQPKDKQFYQNLTKMSMSYIMRRELTSIIKYSACMCS